ncbi:MAG TPA: glycosyltransferase family 4 protein [Vicinamibacterales bacterium]|nr:glycosyltransferase family 4 protein [Vicinamibacterales bacterium]
MKLAFVVQRYGADIAGGSEAHCRELAERLSSRHDITVLTSCARDYVTWANAFPAGESREGAVRVRRFPVARRRRLKVFADLSDEVFAGRAPRDAQDEWFRENGPVVPALLDHLRSEGRSYDVVLFWAYRYFQSYFGLPLVADRAVLVPTAEEDRAIDLDVLADYFRLPAGYLFLTPEEEQLVSTRAGGTLHPFEIIGSGLEPRAAIDARALLERHRIPPEYVLYLGRVDRNKGCDSLLEYFQAFADRPDAPVLVLAGPAKMLIPAHPRIRALGYVPDELRDALLANARTLIVPSPYESLSIALLQGWNYSVPALVNARCRVLDGQVRRANGGLSYRSGREFEAALEYLLTNHAARDAFGGQGLAYVEREYRWPTVIERVERLIAAVGQARGPLHIR